METRISQCSTCGAELDLLTMRCPDCAPPEPPPLAEGATNTPKASNDAETPPAPSAPSPAPTPVPPSAAAPPLSFETDAPPPPAPTVQAVPSHADEAERALGLTLFEAEETLARGHAQKALVIASKAVKEHPASLTARSLFERARRELLRGRRRVRMEERLQEARLLVEGGSLEAAEKIVTSALKLVPNHELALDLFSSLKKRRLAAGTAEAEAEKELLALAQRQANRAAETARAALEAGWERKALLALRRGLRLIPDDAQLLDLLGQTQGILDTTERERARRRVLAAQVRAGVELYRAGRLDDSERALLAVLREDPQSERALAGIERIRAARLARRLPPPTPASPDPAPEPVSQASESPRPARPSARPPIRTLAAGETRRGVAAIAPEIMLPRTRRRGTPWRWIVGAGAMLAIALAMLANWIYAPSPSTPAPRASERPLPARTPTATGGPLQDVDADLRQAIQATLAGYLAALEKGDAERMAAVRPDWTPAQREARLAPFLGALNATSDIRVLDIAVRGDEATVSLQAKDVIVGSQDVVLQPVTETLVFVRQDGIWSLRPSEGGGAERPR